MYKAIRIFYKSCYICRKILKKSNRRDLQECQNGINCITS